MNDNKDFNTVKEFTSVNVGVISEKGVTVDGVEVHDGDVVEAMEGDSLAVLCYAKHGYPGAEIEWTVPEDDNITYDLAVHQVFNYIRLVHDCICSIAVL